MTPEKAKNKICPLGFSELPPCLTEDCMMWRWNDEPPTVDKVGAGGGL